MIKVYESNEKLFENNRIKTLNPILANITKIDNNDYYIEIKDIIDNIDYYQKGMILRTDTPWGVQGFRCNNPSVKNNRIECKAWHLSYDSKNYIVADSYAVDKNCNDTLNHFNDNTDDVSPFNVFSDISTVMSTRAIRKSMFEIFEWLISSDKFGGHWYRDNFNFGIKNSIGEDRGVVLAYKKNITDIKVVEEWDDVCTKLLPFTTDGETAILLDDTYRTLDEKLYDIPYTKVVKFENDLKKEDFETNEEFISATKTLLESKAINYLQEHKFPKINYSVSAKIDNISDVGDILYIKHPKCRVDIQTRVISVVYDVIRKKYIKIEFGNFKKEIKNLSTDITEKATQNAENIIEANNSVIGNSYAINDGDSFLVIDRLPKEDAVYCIKISNGGIGFSSSGINGPFNTAWTIDGILDMQQINVINLTASLIKGGVLKLGGTNNSSGTFELYDTSNKLIGLMDKEGLTVYAKNGDYVKLNAEVGFAGYNKNNEKIYWADGDIFHMKNAEVENEIKIAGKIKIVPVSTSTNVGVGFVAISG